MRHRRCSQPLQRVVTDFAADVAFAQVEDKLVEHYGIFLDESTIRRITLLHAQAILEATPVDDTWPTAAGCQTVIVEMDGGMVPIVEPDTTQTDRRKGKTLVWKEAKLCLAHEAGSQTLSYGGTLQGDVDEAGKQLFACAKHAGFGKTSQVHAVGDGAEWIARQVDERFGGRGGYLVDFYHSMFKFFSIDFAQARQINGSLLNNQVLHTGGHLLQRLIYLCFRKSSTKNLNIE